MVGHLSNVLFDFRFCQVLVNVLTGDFRRVLSNPCVDAFRVQLFRLSEWDWNRLLELFSVNS